MTEQEKINAERRELNTLISRGVNFDVTRTVTVRKNIFSKPKKHTEKLKYTIQEPTLAVLDLISAEQIELVIDENIMSSEQGISEAKRLAHKHARRMARIIALAVIGEDYIIAEQQGARIRYRYDEKRFNELAELFENNLKAIEADSACYSDQPNGQPGGFYELYQIDVRKPDDDADSDRARQTGLKSPYGRRGAICAHFGWTWEYLHHGIAWSAVQRIMADLPSYEVKKDNDGMDLKPENADQIMNLINSLT